VLFTPGDVADPAALRLVEQSLSLVVDYWGIDRDAIARDMGGSERPLCSVKLYSDWEAMGRELGRFDCAGTVIACDFTDPTSRNLPTSEPCAWSPFAVAAGGYPAGDWLAVGAHEIAHVLQRYTWHLGLDRTWVEDELFFEGVAEWTRYAIGSGNFGADSQSLVSFWLRAGGTLDAVPFYFEYDVGASLVERCVRLGGPQKLWAICSETRAIPVGDTGLNWYVLIDFTRAFREAYGVTWDSFVADWMSETRRTNPCPGTELRIRWGRDAFDLRSVLLRPLLRSETRADLERIEQAVVDRTASSTDLDRAEELLRRAPEVGAEIDVAALAAREETLKRYALRVDGARADVVNVLRLGMLVRRGAADPKEYATAFAGVVNAYVPAAVALPLTF